MVNQCATVDIDLSFANYRSCYFSRLLLALVPINGQDRETVGFQEKKMFILIYQRKRCLRSQGLRGINVIQKQVCEICFCFRNLKLYIKPF